MEAQICAIHVCISINTSREISRHLWKLIIWAPKLQRGLLEKLLTWSEWMSWVRIQDYAMILLISSTSRFSTTLAEYKIVRCLCFNLRHCALQRRLGLQIKLSRRLKSGAASGNILCGKRRANVIFLLTMHFEDCLIWAVAIGFSIFKYVH